MAPIIPGRTLAPSRIADEAGFVTRDSGLVTRESSEPSSGPVTEDALTDEVVARLQATPDPRLREVMTALVRHLHAFAKEVRLTDDEWLAGVRFLTETGQTCDDV